MPDSHPAADECARGNDGVHRSDLKRKAVGISRSHCEIFAFLTHGTASLEEAKKALTIITNVRHYLTPVLLIIAINLIIVIFEWLDYKPADVKHS
jgi:hypothetical protein